MITTRRVWLIRHGQSESNAGLPTDGPAAAPLTEHGHDQAARLAATFEAPPALVVSSPFLRARQTARPTLERFPDVPHEEWPVQEFTFLGRLHAPRTTGPQRLPHARAYWERNDPAHATGGDGESFKALITRAHTFLNHLTERPEDGLIAVFTHGIFMKAVIWCLLTGTTDPDPPAMRAFHHFYAGTEIPNCTVTELWRPIAPHPFRLIPGATTHLTAPAPEDHPFPALD
ncbi:histidine phosphatase family protein [Thermomonospora umbrina]|uniref:Broad specificity phosphatase PhoE n=1 Tax=Thermomonospora umbrina TaxID=111806 RepID=A0A3D9SLN8_9ACTN|nr:histidine phosphatase family protein [Thermomonospora umbrina]REE96829.1 broad specificity phosphatase PhoE [Thermomonospora umbrina]